MLALPERDHGRSKLEEEFHNLSQRSGRWAQIAKVCPGVELVQKSGDRRDHPLWGPFIDMYSGHAIDPDLRHSGASGGGLSALLLHLLETGSVDQVLQVAADPELPIGNRIVLSSDVEGVKAASGSRYAPSAPLEGIERLLNLNRTYAFVGKPCDVAALNAMKRFDQRVAQRFPYLISFFCAGVPSLHGVREVLDRLEVAEEDVTGFRYRGNGWPGFATATLRDGSTRRMSYADSWGKVLSRHVQFRCKICPDGTGGFADVVCADAWETDEKGYPVFTEKQGVSLIVSRTERGEALVREAAAARRIAISGFDPTTLAAMQPGQTRKRRLTLARMGALRVLGHPSPKYRGFYLLRNAVRAGPLQNIRNFLGTLRRIIQNRW